MILTTEEFANICCYPEEYAGLLSEETEPLDPDVFNALRELMGSEIAIKMNMHRMLHPNIQQTHSEFSWTEWKDIYNRIFSGKSPSELINFATRNFPQVKCRDDLLQYLPKISP
ncbi:MAG: hypothetical protein LDL41_05265 [Coleofasciculus sp. S288]|nr:hypothetical protein [Coleofasciculus sp. S288]